MIASESQQNRRQAVILTAIAAEYKAVRAHLTDIKEFRHPQGTVYEQGRFSCPDQTYWDVSIVEIGPGNAAAAFETERAITYFQPRVLLFVGVAGGIKDVQLCDVVAATRVYGYETGKAKADFKPRPDVGESSYPMIQRARAEAKKSEWLKRLKGCVLLSKSKVYIGPIAAGEKVVSSTKSAVYRFLRGAYGDALAVEMEGRGFLKAAHANPEVSALIIRGISDLLDGKEKTDAADYQELASKAASAFAFEVLANLEGGRERGSVGKGKSELGIEVTQSRVTAGVIEPLGPVTRAQITNSLFGMRSAGNQEASLYQGDLIQHNIIEAALTSGACTEEWRRLNAHFPIWMLREYDVGVIDSTVLGFDSVTLEFTVHLINRSDSTRSIHLELSSERRLSDSRWPNLEEPLRYQMKVPKGASAVRIDLRPSAEETLVLRVQLWPEIARSYGSVQGDRTLRYLQTTSAFAQYLTSGSLGPFTLPDTDLNNPEHLTFELEITRNRNLLGFQPVEAMDQILADWQRVRDVGIKELER